MTDLDLACVVLDLARHAIAGPGRRIERTKDVLFGEDAARLVREWEDRKRRAAALDSTRRKGVRGEA